MAVIPFGLVGAIAGHVIMGLDLSMISLFGVVALSGVVVNSSLVLVDGVNRRRALGMSKVDALRAAGVSRFRPIVLTSLTTIGGLAPLLFETNLQAQFLIPVAITLVFGISVATLIVLIVVPALLGILEDVQRFFARPRRAGPPSLASPETRT